jgi:putative SOS response-associated peptidase YedK
VAKIHNRMPFIVQPRQYEWWLDDEQFRAVLDAPDRSALEARPVQRELNNIRNEGDELLKPPLAQPGLF